jgi:predicted ArsR family transcriptional regulator
MQQTRQYILETLRERDETTVDELVQALRARINHDITAVTVRHHLDVLRAENLITAPIVRHRNTRGRPQYAYKLTPKALQQFPNNYQHLAAALLNQIKATLPEPQINVILEKVADEMVINADLLDIPINARLDHVVKYLNEQGYEACWEACPEGFLLHTRNCPYHHLASEHDELCSMDMRLIAGLTGVIPRRVAHLANEESDSCSYLLPMLQTVGVGPTSASTTVDHRD